MLVGGDVGLRATGQCQADVNQDVDVWGTWSEEPNAKNTKLTVLRWPAGLSLKQERWRGWAAEGIHPMAFAATSVACGKALQAGP